MLILWLILDDKLDTNTRVHRLVSIVSHRFRNIADANPFWMMSQILGRKGNRLGETTRPPYYASEWIKLKHNLWLGCESVWRIVNYCLYHEINELQYNARHADTMRSHLLSNPGRPQKTAYKDTQVRDGIFVFQNFFSQSYKLTHCVQNFVQSFWPN